VVAAVLSLNEARHLYFFGDDWAFLLKRDLSGDGLLEPHNEHWSTIPLLVYRTLFHVVGIDHYLLWAAMPVVLHLTVCGLLFALLRRHGIGPWVAVLATLLLAFGAGGIGENILWPFQIGFLGSATLGLTALLLADRLRPDQPGPDQPGPDRPGPGRWGLVLVWIATMLSLMCSGMAVPMAIWLGALVLLDRGLRAALLTVTPPMVVYLVWYVAYARDVPSTAPDPTVDLALEFTWTGIASLWQLVTRVPSTGGAVFLALLGLVLLGRVPARARGLALSGLLAVLATFLVLAVSRSGFGPAVATQSRYAYFGLLMTLPAFAVAVSWMSERMAERPVERRLAWVVVVVLLATSGWAQLHTFRVGRELAQPGLRQRVIGAAELVRDDARFLQSAVEPTFSPDLTVDTLAHADVLDSIPDNATTPQGRLDAAVTLQSTAGPLSPGLTDPAQVLRSGLAPGRAEQQGCRRFLADGGAYLELPPSATGSQLLLVTRDAVLRVQMIGRLGESYIRPYGVVPGTPTYVATSSAEATLRVYVDSAKIEICAP
jgi:hypothetical protein